MAYRFFVLTSSDSGYAGEREDISGPTAAAMLREAGWEQTGYALLPDDRELLSQKLREVCDKRQAELLITTGGTGFSRRDCMPEATAAVCERMVPGIPEAMRYYSLQITPRAMLSRAAAGICGDTLIVNLPGSPKAVRENLSAILDTLEHAVHMLQGQGH
jgi:molybdenum cofactor synthesis domain-containing protein